MIYNLPFDQIGFQKQEWDSIPSGSRSIIRDFYLNGRNITATQEYEYHATDFSVRRVVQKYKLRQRPPLVIHPDDLRLI